MKNMVLRGFLFGLIALYGGTIQPAAMSVRQQRIVTIQEKLAGLGDNNFDRTIRNSLVPELNTLLMEEAIEESRREQRRLLRRPMVQPARTTTPEEQQLDELQKKFFELKSGSADYEVMQNSLRSEINRLQDFLLKQQHQQASIQRPADAQEEEEKKTSEAAVVQRERPRRDDSQAYLTNLAQQLQEADAEAALQKFSRTGKLAEIAGLKERIRRVGRTTQAGIEYRARLQMLQRTLDKTEPVDRKEHREQQEQQNRVALIADIQRLSQEVDIQFKYLPVKEQVGYVCGYESVFNTKALHQAFGRNAVNSQTIQHLSAAFDKEKEKCPLGEAQIENVIAESDKVQLKNYIIASTLFPDDYTEENLVLKEDSDPLKFQNLKDQIKLITLTQFKNHEYEGIYSFFFTIPTGQRHWASVSVVKKAGQQPYLVYLDSVRPQRKIPDGIAFLSKWITQQIK